MKAKSHSGAKKRFSITGTGKAKMRKGAKNHLLYHKSKRQKKFAKNGMIVDPSNMGRVRALLPNTF